MKIPEIAVAVILENAGHGGSAAAPVARKVIDAYFARKHLLQSRLQGTDTGGGETRKP